MVAGFVGCAGASFWKAHTHIFKSTHRHTRDKQETHDNGEEADMQPNRDKENEPECKQSLQSECMLYILSKRAQLFFLSFPFFVFVLRIVLFHEHLWDVE